MCPTDEVSSGMHLLPEPLFSIPTDGSYVLTIQGTQDGRIFMGAKDGCLYELVYQVRPTGKLGQTWSLDNHKNLICSIIIV